MTANKVDVGALEALLAKATPGEFRPGDYIAPYRDLDGDNDFAISEIWNGDHEGAIEVRAEDSVALAELIAAAVNALPELLRIYRAWQGAAVVEVTECNQIPGASDFDFGDMLAAMQAFPIGTRVRLLPDDGQGAWDQYRAIPTGYPPA